MCRTSPHRRPRLGSLALGLVALLVMGAALPSAVVAQGPGNAAGFEVDGNLRCSEVTGGIAVGEDWFVNPPSVCVGVIDATLCVPNPARLPALFQRDEHWAGNAADPTHFSGMSNKNNDNIASGVEPYSWGSGSGPQKNDITEVYVHARTDISGDLWLILGAATRSSNGDEHIDFEFNRAGIQKTGTTSGQLVGLGPNNGRTIDDIIVSVDFTIGGTNPIAEVRLWNGTEYVLPSVAPPVFAATNFANTPAPCGATAPNGDAATEYIPQQWAEAAINISAVGIPLSTLCNAASTVTVKTRSSQSFTAELKDFALYPFTILQPPTCAIDGASPVCPNSSNQYCGRPGLLYGWSISGGGSIVGDTNAQCVTVQADPACGSYTLSLTVTDANGCASGCDKTVLVEDSVAPVATFCPGNQTIQCPATPQFGNPTFTDNCDNSLNISFQDATTPGVCPQEYVATRTWTASDDCNNTAQCSQSITVDDSTPPMIGQPGANATIQCPAAPVFTPPTATDACDPNPVVMLVSDVTTPSSCPGVYSRTRTWKAVDACGNQSPTVSQTINVVDTAPPTIGQPGANATIQCPAAPVFTPPSASDTCDPDPDVILVSDVTTPGSCSGVYSRTRCWKARDCSGNESATVCQTINVVDTAPPTIGQPGANATIQCPAAPVFTPPSASDTCDPDPEVILVSDVTTPGSCPGVFSRARCWKARDCSGNESATVCQTINVVDTAPPTIGQPGANATIQCPATPVFTPPTATDACDPNPVVMLLSDVTTPGDCPQENSRTRCWKAVDCSGNQSATVCQTINVVDTTPPSISCPGNLQAACDEVVTFAPTATDVCDGNVPVVCDPPSGSVFPVGTTTVDCTATDDCGNSAQCAFEVTVLPCEQHCWLTGGGAKFSQTLNLYVAEHTRRHNFGGNVYPGCSPTSGDGGQWNHVDEDLRLHFQGFTIVVDRCGNVDGIPPGSDSPETPFNFIEFHGTGRVQGIKGNKTKHDPAYFFARCEDRNEPGSRGQRDGAFKDRYFLHVYTNPSDPAGSTVILVDLDGNAATVDPVTITDGNLQIHISSCDNPPLFAQGGVQEATLSPGVEGADSGDVPGGTNDVELYRPLPNPFASTTGFAYAVPAGSGLPVDIGVYDLAGRRVRTLVSGVVGSGRHEASWDGRNEVGARVNNGIYFIHSSVGRLRKTVSVVYLR